MKAFLKILPVTAAVLLVASCLQDKYPTEFEGEGSHIVVNDAADWNTFDLPAYVGDISAYPADLQTVIRQFFPRSAGMDVAKIIFVGPGEVAANNTALAGALDNNAFVVYPGSVDASSLLDIDPVIATFEEPAGYKPLFHCHSNFGAGTTYTMWEEPEVAVLEAVEPSLSEAEWEELVKASRSLGEESGYVLSDFDNEPDFNVNYYQTRMDTFVDWLEGAVMEQTMTKANPYEDMKASIENLGQRLTHNFPYSLNKQIDKGTGCDPDVLSKSGSLDVEFRIYPCYLQSANGDDKAGDYYSVVSTVTPHNASMWGPFVGAHGWTRNRVYGFWFNKMSVATSLVNTDGSSIGGLEYYDRPIPENKNSSKQYSNGKTVSISGTVSGGYGAQQKGHGEGSFSVGGSWTSSTNYTLETIEYSLDSSTPTVKYSYWTNNVKLTDDYDDWNKINNVDYPASCRTEFSSHTMWTWRVPGGTVGDGDTRTFKLKTKITINYAAWHHWRATAEFDSNKKDFDINLPEISWDLKAPDRTPWGFIRLRNASGSEMAHVSYYKSGEEDGEPVAVQTYSYGKGDDAWMALAEGTYSVRWDLINGDTQEKVGSYIYRNVKVHPGRDKDSATTAISSVDGVKE